MSDKILKLDQAQTLYQDLRGRIDALPTSEDIPDVPVQDVQVNGTSVLSNGVANIPYASSDNSGGIVRANNNYGIAYAGAGLLAIDCADNTVIKAGSDAFHPIVPYFQHAAAFYGLAKAAGADEKNSTLSVGTYTETAKSAIRTMLGAASPNVIAVQDTQPTDTETKVWLPETEATGIQVPTMEDMTNYVLKTDYATSSAPGIVQISKGDGIGISSSAHTIYINAATSALVKAGTDEKRPIVPSNQHEAVFYGLAKVAGDATQAASENAVGTYTTSAKSAIQTMLGIKYTLTVTVLTQDNVTVTNQIITLREGGPIGQIYATATYSGQPVSFALPTGFSYYVSVSDTLAHHFNPTTASGIITDADASVTLTYSDFSSIQTAADIKAALNAGLDLTDLVGEQISCTWNNSTLVWDVVDYSNDTITLLTHDTLPTQLVFEPVQALMWCENGLAAGSYSFIDGSSTYYFTLTTAIPSGGQLRATTSAFQTYASMEATATLETGTVSITEISGAISLGTTATGNLNHMSRVNYGSNNYKESALFQWLNSTEAANTPMPRITKFSRPCTYSVPGFLGALDSSFVAAIDDTTWLCSTNNTYECPTSLGGTVAKSNAYTVTAKVGLASEMEIFGSYGGTADGSTVFDLFNGATADDRKKYQPSTSTARIWWLRSPSWNYASGGRGVVSSGTAGVNYAYNSYGVVPAVKISKTVVSE